MAMKLSLTSWSLPACSLEEAAGISKVLGIGALDISYFYRPALDKARLLAEPERVADEVRALGIDLPCLYHLFGTTLGDRNLADPRHLEANAADLKQAVRFCKRAGRRRHLRPAGGDQSGPGPEGSPRPIGREPAAAPADRGRSRDHAHGRAARPLLVRDAGPDARAARRGARTEARRSTMPTSSASAIARRRSTCSPRMPGTSISARRKRASCRPSSPRARSISERELATLKAAGFDGHIALEYTHQDYMDSLFDDVLTETIQLRDVVRAWEAA